MTLLLLSAIVTRTVEINDREEFEKLTDLGTVYNREDRIVVATSVGVSENADTEDVQSRRVDFVYRK